MGDDVSAHKDLRKGERVGWGGVGCEQDRAGWPCIRHIHYWSAEGKQTCALEEMGGKRRGGDRLLMFLFNCETFTARAWCVATWTYQTTSAPYIFLLLLFSFTLSYPFPTQCRPVPDEPGVRLACHKKKRTKPKNKLSGTEGCANAIIFHSQESKHGVVTDFCYLHAPGSVRSQAVPCVKTFCFLKCALSSRRRNEWVVVEVVGYGGLFHSLVVSHTREKRNKTTIPLHFFIQSS